MTTTLRFIAAAACVFATAAHAQIFRAYLSLNGSDTNPCTAAAPCRLLPAAIDAVADGGEIWMLDSANFNAGTVEIVKNLSILAVPGAVGSIVAVGGNPAINHTGAKKLVLRNVVVSDNAANHGTYGVLLGNNSVLVVDGCVFSNLSNQAILATGSSKLEVRDSLFRGNGMAIEITNGAVASISRADFLGNSIGVMAESVDASITRMVIADSVFSRTSNTAISALATVAGAVATVQVTRSSVEHNGFGIAVANFGVGTASITLSGNTIVANGENFNVSGTGDAIYSMGDNLIAEATIGNAGTLTPVALQ
jgi:hypothetical protein